MGSKGKWSVWVWVKWKPGTPATAWESWKEHPSVKGVWSTQGNWDCSIWIDAKSPDELEEFVWKEVRKSQWVEATETHWAKQLMAA